MKLTRNEYAAFGSIMNRQLETLPVSTETQMAGQVQMEDIIYRIHQAFLKDRLVVGQQTNDVSPLPFSPPY